jgi:TusA-related sulfurtransferase
MPASLTTLDKAPAAHAAIDASGLSCGQLEPLIAHTLRAMAPGQVLEIRADRPEARDGIGAWVWLTGHTLVGVVEDKAPHNRYFVRKNSKQNR